MSSLNSNFIKVRCDKCKNEQVIYGKASTKITCLVCGEILATPRGGKTNVVARVLEVLN
jgi:small subunit ribosomal protein S27e